MAENTITRDDIAKFADEIAAFLRKVSRKEVESQYTRAEQESFSELLSWLTSQTGSKLEELIQDLFKDISSAHQSRLERYKVYEHIYSLIPLCKRVIAVYKSQLMLRDPITGSRYIVRPCPLAKNEKSDVLSRAESIARNIMESFRIIRRLRNLDLNILLKKGDVFTEIIDLSKVKIKSKDDVVLTESDVLYLEQTYKSSPSRAYDRLALSLFHIEEADEVHLNPSERVKSERIYLRTIGPERIVPLVDRYGKVYGYVEVSLSQAEKSGPLGERLAKTVLSLSGMPGGFSQGHNSPDTLISVAKQITQRLLDTLSKKYDFATTSLDDVITREFSVTVADFIRTILLNIKTEKVLRQGKVRFIPVSRMARCTIPSEEYFPYGISVLDPMVLPGRMYILTMLANLVIKMSRASVLRKWWVEVGPRLQHSQLVQEVLKETRNKITIDEIAAMKSLPRILTEFKEMILVTKGGQRYLDVEIQPLGDPNVKTADLEELRRDLIVASGVPAPYLGMIDTVELREQLVHANVTFANTIADYQDQLTDYLTDLVSTIAKFSYPDDEIAQNLSNYIEVRLIPPVVLMLQFMEQTMSSVGNLVNMFRGLQMNVDPIYMLKTYLPYVDWDEFEKHGLLNRVETDISMQAGGTGGGGGAGY